MLIPSQDIKASSSFIEKKFILLGQIFISSVEMFPLMVFIFLRVLDWGMPSRILTGAAISICVFLFYFVANRSLKFSPPYFSTNIFFIFAGAILLLPMPETARFFLKLGEVGMFLTILLIGICWHFWSPNGVLPRTEKPPKTKLFSWVLIGVFGICPLIAWHFKGNEDLAGGFPFLIIVITEKVLNYFQSKN